MDREHVRASADCQRQHRLRPINEEACRKLVRAGAKKRGFARTSDGSARSRRSYRPRRWRRRSRIRRTDRSQPATARRLAKLWATMLLPMPKLRPQLQRLAIMLFATTSTYFSSLSPARATTRPSLPPSAAPDKLGKSGLLLRQCEDRFRNRAARAALQRPVRQKLLKRRDPSSPLQRPTGAVRR